MLSGEFLSGPLVADNAGIDFALKHTQHAVHIKRLPAIGFTRQRLVCFAPKAQSVQFLCDADCGLVLDIERKDATHQFGFFLVHHQQLIFRVIAQRRQPAAPQAFLRPRQVEIL
ncbi:MAG: hypothetical protein WC421_06740 [Elusimicrobiales bacterium]